MCYMAIQVYNVVTSLDCHACGTPGDGYDQFEEEVQETTMNQGLFIGDLVDSLLLQTLLK